MPRLEGKDHTFRVRHAIIEKLDAELRKGIETEAQVVYVLVEIRKLIEHSEHRPRYLPLQFYCDWALHTTLDRAPAREFLGEINDAIERKETNEQVAARIGRKFSMDVFREELIHFLIDHHLPVDPIRTSAPWITFLRCYLEVISDSPLQSGRVELKHVDKVVLTVSHDVPESVSTGLAFVYTLRWTFFRAKDEMFTWANEVYRAGASKAEVRAKQTKARQ